MRWRDISSFAVALVAFAFLANQAAELLLAQPPGQQRPQQHSPDAGKNNRDAKKEEPPAALPTDPKLISFHREFVGKVEKLAADYERSKQPEKAIACYEEILKLVPQYSGAQQKLNQLREKELSAERKVMDLHANRPWQDAGIMLVPGKPVRILASGKWTFNLSHELSPKGMQIPKELREFDLGSLVGVIITPGQKKEDVKPFLVGERYEFVAEAPGRLLLQMHDTDHSDNAGRLNVEIHGTFEKE